MRFSEVVFAKGYLNPDSKFTFLARLLGGVGYAMAKRKHRLIIKPLSPFDKGKRAFPQLLERKMERQVRRTMQLEEQALLSHRFMSIAERRRLRTEAHSDRVVRLEEAYTAARKDMKRLLSKSPLPDSETDYPKQASVWRLVFDLGYVADSSNMAREWASLMMYAPKVRARPKGGKTCPLVKGLLDFLAEQRFYNYDPKTRVYTVAWFYEYALHRMRSMEADLLKQLFEERKTIRDR